jgi:hypothetical protein
MCTLLLAFINAKYKYDYCELFVGTFIIDLAFINFLRIWVS